MGIRVESWNGGVSLSIPTSWTSAFELSDCENTREIFARAIFQTNTSKFDIRVTVDSVVVLEDDLNVLVKDFKLRQEESEPGASARFYLSEYAGNRWKFAPFVPIKPNSTMKVEFKSHSGTKKVVRGRSEVITR